MPRAGEVVAVLPFGDVDAAGAAADDHAERRIARLQSRIVERLARREDGNAGDLRIATRIGTAVKPVAVRPVNVSEVEAVDGDGRRYAACEI